MRNVWMRKDGSSSQQWFRNQELHIKPFTDTYVSEDYFMWRIVGMQSSAMASHPGPGQAGIAITTQSSHSHLISPTTTALFVSDGIKIGEKLGRCDLILTLLSGVLIMRLQHFRHCRQFSPFLNCVLSGLYLLLSLASFDSLKLRYDCHSLSSRNQHLCHWKGICGMLIAPCCSDTSRVKLDPATILLSKLVNCAWVLTISPLNII